MMAGEQRRSTLDQLGLAPVRALPYNIEMEQAVLGALLMHNNAWNRCNDILTPDSFFEDLHRRIYSVMLPLLEQGKTANALTIKSYFSDQDLGGVTVPQYLARLSAEAAPVSELRGYALFLHDLKTRRDIISIAQDALDHAYDMPSTETSKALLDGTLDRLSALKANPEERTGFEAFGTASYRAILTAQQSYQRGGELTGLSTGYSRLDDIMGGLQKTDLIILAGRPGMGKTALATNVSFRIAMNLQAQRDQGHKTGVVAFYSLEMSAERLSARIISEQSGVPEWKVRRGKLTGDDLEAMCHVQRDLEKIPLLIDETGGMTISTLRSTAKQLKKRQGLELIVVDYLQLLNGMKGKDNNRTQEVTEITVGLKALAKELQVPVLALSQLSRQVEARDDKRPQLADLRESGSIEQDADIVMFVYREEYYLKKQKPPQEGSLGRETYDRKMALAKGIAEVIVGKNRHGPDGSVEMGFEGSVTRFLNEPEPRDDAYEPIRKEKQETIKYHAMSGPCLKTLQRLDMQMPLMGEQPGVPKWVQRCVEYEVWKEKCCGEYLDPNASDAEKIKFMKDATWPLMRAEVIERGGEGYRFVWLTEKGRK